MMNKGRYSAFSATALAMCLAACGGVSGQPVASTPPAPPPVPAPSPTPSPSPAYTSGHEYNNSLPVNYAKAEAAYEMGITGEGVTIAIIDTGIDVDNIEFEGRISEDSVSIPATYSPCAGCSIKNAEYPLDDIQGHGTMVASVAAGGRNGNSTHGVAYDATILAVKVAGANNINVAEGEVPEESGINGGMVPSAVHWSVNHGSFVINMSLGGTATGHYADKYYAAMSAVAENDLLLVQSVPNADAYEFDETITAAMVGADFENVDNFLFAIRVDNRREPIPNNGTPGPLAYRTLAVAAHNIILMGVDERWVRASGNSFAAPAVSGAAALLKEYWPQLTGSQIADILLSTATDMGEPGVDQYYGVGMLNIEEAMSANSAQIGATAQSMVPLSGTALFTSGPFGGAAGGNAFNQGNAPTYAIDRWGRDFKIDASNLVHGLPSSSLSVFNLVGGTFAPKLTPHEETLGGVGYAANRDDFRNANSPRQYGIRLSPTTSIYGTRHSNIAPSDAISTSLLSSAGVPTYGTTTALAHHGNRVTVGMAKAANPTDPSTTVSAKLDLANGLSASYAASREHGSALGMRGTGAFEIRGAQSDFVTLGWSGEIQNFQLAAEAIAGRTEIEAAGDSLVFDDPVLSAGFRLAAQGPLFGGDILFGLTSPLKVERANVTYTAAGRYDPETRSLVHQANKFDMASTARELDLEFGYARNLSLGQISLNAGYSINAGNAAGQSAAAASLRFDSAL